MRRNQCAVYVLTNARRTVLYIGVTSDLERRLAQHRAGVHPESFVRRYNATRLVYFELTPSITVAIDREKQLKKWRRSKKDALVESMNPEWRDLWPEGGW